MKKYLLLIAALFYCFNSKAQITLAHSFSKPIRTESEIVNLSLSGKKIMTLTQQGDPDTIYFYNMDYSFWKWIICPIIPGYNDPFQIYPDGNWVSVFFPSETLFNTDSLLEIALFYQSDSIGISRGKILIVNENGTIVDSILNVVQLYTEDLKIYNVDTLGIGSQMVISTMTGVNVYNLPGSLPCNLCGNGPGLAVEKNNIKPNNFSTEPLPNPSSNEVKITFTLPSGAQQGELDLYNSLGAKIKSYQVDNRFGFILLDNTLLPAGMYYYNIVVNGEVSATQKMVLVK